MSLYSVGRFLVETLRVDPAFVGGSVRGNLLVSGALALGFALLLLRDTLARPKAPRAAASSSSVVMCHPQGRSINPNSKPCTTAWVRSETPSLEMMCSTWFLAVPRLITRSAAIWRLVRPSFISPRTSSSRGVRDSTA